MEKLKIKFVKMGMDIKDNAEGLNHRMRAIIPTDDGDYIFIEIICGTRTPQQYTNITQKKVYFERYPHEHYIYIDAIFRVDVPEDYYKNYSSKYRDFVDCHFKEEFTKENIIKVLQKLNKNIIDFELTDNYYLDEFCEKMGFYRLHDTRLQHKIEPLKILNHWGDNIIIEYLYTAWNYNRTVEYQQKDRLEMNFADIVETPDGRKITKKERFVEMYGIDTYNILIEEYEKSIENLKNWKKPTILQCKNKYGYTIKQLKIDYNKKIFAVGSFTMGADETITRKALHAKIEELKALNFEEVATC